MSVTFISPVELDFLHKIAYPRLNVCIKLVFDLSNLSYEFTIRKFVVF